MIKINKMDECTFRKQSLLEFYCITDEDCEYKGDTIEVIELIKGMIVARYYSKCMYEVDKHGNK